MAVTFPTTPEVVQVLTDNLGFGEKVKIREVHHTGDDDQGLSYWLDQAIHEMGAPLSLQEFNDLAVKLHSMDEEQREIFGAVLQSPWAGDTLTQLIDIAENLDAFELYTIAHNAESFGDISIEMDRNETAGCYYMLEHSTDPNEQEFFKYIQRLEKCVNKEAYGRLVAEQEGGVLTDFGYLRRIEDISKESTLDEAIRPPVKVKPSLKETLEANRQKSREMFGDGDPTPTREKGEYSL